MREEAVLELVRAMRHSSLNHLQVIAGWLQLGHQERAQAYIAGVLERLAAEAGVTRLPCPRLALALLEPGARAELHGVGLRWHLTVSQGCAVSEPIADLVRDLLLAAVSELGGVREGPPPTLTVALETSGGGLALRLRSSHPLSLQGLPERAAALGTQLTGAGSDAPVLVIPPSAGA